MLQAAAAAASASDYVETYFPLKWNADMMQPNITLQDDDSTAVHVTSQWNSVCGNRWLEPRGVYEVEIGTPNVDNISLFVGIVERGFWQEVQVAEDGEEVLPRNSKHSICIHGDGRIFIRGSEKDWGLMRIATGDPVHLTLDYQRGVVIFRMARTVRGKERETVAEIPGLRNECTLMACFGGRDQALTIARCEPVKSADHKQSSGRVRDAFTEAMGKERVAPIAFTAPAKVGSYEQQIADVAATMETSM
jgi:hypothetical protein